MDNIVVSFTRQEAIAVKFALGGARQTINSHPHYVAPLNDAIAKVDEALNPSVAESVNQENSDTSES